MNISPYKPHNPRTCNNKHPKIVCVAVIDIDYLNMYFLPAPNRHHHVIHAMYEHKLIPDREGFLTDMGTFVGREVGLIYAMTNKQVKPIRDATSYNGRELFSEDLW